MVEEGSWEVASVLEQDSGGEQSAAARAGIQSGDRILFVEGQSTAAWSDLVEIVRSRPNETVQLEVLRGETNLSMATTLGADGDGLGLLGIRGQKATKLLKYGPLGAVRKTGTESVTMRGQPVRGIWTIVANLGEVADRIFSPPNDPPSLNWT